MNKVINYQLIGGLFLLSACSTTDIPAAVVATNISPSPTELPINLVSTPSLTSTIIIAQTPSPLLTGTFSTSEVTPTIPLTPYIKMSKMDFPTGLVWLECEVSFDQYQKWRVADKCFGFPLSSWQDEDRARLGEIFQRNPFKLYDIRNTINGNFYETDNEPGGLYTLYKNGKVFAESVSGTTTYSPNRSLQNVGGKAVWELANPENPTIIFDGMDLRQEYDLDAAYLPYNINDRLIFVAKKDSKYYVMYGEEQIGPGFKNISIAYCCGPAGYSIQRVQGQYWFWGIRNSRYYLVLISADE
jgi:hypothetical protein